MNRITYPDLPEFERERKQEMIKDSRSITVGTPPNYIEINFGIMESGDEFFGDGSNND
jgi:hypothetical protein